METLFTNSNPLKTLNEAHDIEWIQILKLGNKKGKERIMTTEKTWHEHKLLSDLLWEAFAKTLLGTREREDAKNAYLDESKSFWGEESLGITQLQGRIEAK